LEQYFYWLLGLSLFFWMLEIILPWRQHQVKIRQDFWLDGFYMFFNFFLFSLVGFNVISNSGVEAFSDFLGLFGVKNLERLKYSHGWCGRSSLRFLLSAISYNGTFIACCTALLQVSCILTTPLSGCRLAPYVTFSTTRRCIPGTMPSTCHAANYGISLSVWDYLFGTSYMSENGRDIELNLDEVEKQWHPLRECRT
jgi:hypothetical protein